MKIKKHSNKNHYLLAGNSGVWIRDITRPNVPYIDINHLTSPADYQLLLHNEIQNKGKNLQHIDTEDFIHPTIVIISDGYGFKEKQNLLADLPKDVIIIAVNGALAAWELIKRQRVHYYVVNNPYTECMSFFPRKNRYFPKCIASMRTNPDFIRQYSKKGTMYRYLPTPEVCFSTMKSDALYHIDDYRNPICAALGLAYRMEAQKILLFCCDDSFLDERAGSVAAREGLFTYPHHLISRDIIDGTIHWIVSQEDMEVEVASYSSIDYYNVPYIDNMELSNFLRGFDGIL